MKEHELTELLARVDGVRVSPAPLDALHSGAVRRRRRRRWTGVAATLGVVAMLVGGATALLGQAPRGEVPVAVEQVSDVLPDGMRWAGLGSVAVAVPREWGTNETHCGTPQQDTVVVWQGVIGMCLVPRPAGVESVELSESELPGFESDTTVVVDGVEAERQSTTCGKERYVAGKDGVLCSAALHFPDHGVWVRVESSTDAETVDALLARVHVLDDLVGVPDHSGIAVDEQANWEETYAALLRERGFDVRVETEQRWGMTSAYVLGVSPSPGTVVEPGSTVTVVTVAEPEGPGDEVSIGVGADSDPSGEITETAVRSGDLTVRLEVGERVWAYADGKRSRTLTGEVTGKVLAVSDWVDGPNHPRSWVATEPGRSTVVLTIEVDGQPLELARFTVIVD